MPETTFATIADLPEDYQLIQSENEVGHVLDSIGCVDSYAAILFVKFGDGEYLDIYGSDYSVPVLTNSVYQIKF